MQHPQYLDKIGFQYSKISPTENTPNKFFEFSSTVALKRLVVVGDAVSIPVIFRPTDDVSIIFRRALRRFFQFFHRPPANTNTHL